MGKEIKCAKCGDIIQSQYRHDFRWCFCKSIFIDGGDDYCRIGGEFKNILVEYNGNWISWEELRKERHD